MDMEKSFEEEPAKWRAKRKVPFKQVSFGLKQLIENGIAQHMKQLDDALLELQMSHEPKFASTYRERVRHALSLLTQDLRQIEEMKSSVKDEDLSRFDKAAETSRREIHEALKRARIVIDSDFDRLRSHQSSEVSPKPDGDRTNSNSAYSDDTAATQNSMQELLLINECERLREQAQDLESLTQDMQVLKEMMGDLKDSVVEQGEALEAIEHHVETAATNVTRGELLLAQARHLKTAALPIVGLTVGFAAGGPIGAIAGVRIGFATSMIGGALGYAGGKVLHKFNNLNPLGPRFRMPALRTSENPEVDGNQQ
ncbi:syntaxin-17 [Galendromus occidentalis]|uniref:Syntaxin-17 n=1 Tax=Galendromus occidentalis TaxID=34638 RepID=A0AAJ6QML2_9ACAR|nr:syntaxin-17 [Galendromus occidentalis]